MPVEHKYPRRARDIKTIKISHSNIRPDEAVPKDKCNIRHLGALLYDAQEQLQIAPSVFCAQRWRERQEVTRECERCRRSLQEWIVLSCDHLLCFRCTAEILREAMERLPPLSIDGSSAQCPNCGENTLLLLLLVQSLNVHMIRRSVLTHGSRNVTDVLASPVLADPSQERQLTIQDQTDQAQPRLFLLHELRYLMSMACAVLREKDHRRESIIIAENQSLTESQTPSSTISQLSNESALQSARQSLNRRLTIPLHITEHMLQTQSNHVTAVPSNDQFGSRQTLAIPIPFRAENQRIVLRVLREFLAGRELAGVLPRYDGYLLTPPPPAVGIALLRPHPRHAFTRTRRYSRVLTPPNAAPSGGNTDLTSTSSVPAEQQFPRLTGLVVRQDDIVPNESQTTVDEPDLAQCFHLFLLSMTAFVILKAVSLMLLPGNKSNILTGLLYETIETFAGICAVVVFWVIVATVVALFYQAAMFSCRQIYKVLRAGIKFTVRLTRVLGVRLPRFLENRA